MTEYYGAIEAGGTKFNCAICDPSGAIVEQTRIATTTPDETLERVVQWFSQQRQGGKLRGVGIASFGPLDLNPDSARYGWITSTPKPHWSDTPLLPKLASALNVPMVIDTDVNGAALAEADSANARSCRISARCKTVYADISLLDDLLTK